MIWLFFILLFILTFVGGLIPLYIKTNAQWSANLLAYSGAVLIGITFLHLLAESFNDLNHKAGVLILIGFFLQLFLQKYSHGLEHGHSHVHEHRHISFVPIFTGLAVHAFLEGLPLGYQFREAGTIPSLFIGIAAHKLPEALSLMSVVVVLPISKANKWRYLFQFALITPVAGVLAWYYGQQYLGTAQILTYLVPVVIGAFIHISTTIFFESGAKYHQLNTQKIIAVVAGMLTALLTLGL
jgi:zinc and cadmium transporter